MIGCSEEEYRQFVQAAERRSRVRPAGYEHIPDIRMDPITTAIVVSLAVGVISTAVSYFLAPKPKGLDSRDGVKQRRLSDRTGADRFAQTYGFDSQADLADYGSPVPIIFTRYTGTSGGILAGPSLVWSRAASYGRQQGVKQLMVVGEAGLGQGIPAPELNGIFIGNGPLDTALAHTFAFYWNRAGGRIFASNLLYGTRGGVATGDPQSTNDVFLCPTASADEDTGFSSAHSLSNNSEFGVYAPIHNGTDYRLNFRLVPIPSIEGQSDDPGYNLLMERVKISGDYGFNRDVIGNDEYRSSVRKEGQRGTGRGYSRRMGIISVNGQSPSDEKEEYSVSVGSQCEFFISERDLKEDLYFIADTKNTKVDDINNDLQSQRIKADEALQLGETFMIGKTIWKVTARSSELWTKGSTQTVTLECVEIFGRGNLSRVGAINKDTMIDRGRLTDDDGVTALNGYTGTHAGPNFYPLLKVQMGLVRNLRACEVTEIGLRSQVWNRANGICNFSSLPTPSEFFASEKNGVSVNNGNMTLFFKRSSMFSIQVRPAGTDDQGDPYDWDNIGEQFCITGSQPTDQYNFVRIKHPERRQYEFRFVPISGAHAIQAISDTEQVWRLNANSSRVLSSTFTTPYGQFTVESRGSVKTVAEIKFNPEMMQSAIVSDGETTYSIPEQVVRTTWIPDIESSAAQATAMSFLDWLPQGSLQGRKGAYFWEKLGAVSSAGQVRSFTTTATGPAGVTAEVRITAVSVVANNTTSGQSFNWDFSSVAVISSAGGWNTGDDASVTATVSTANPWRYTGLTTAGILFNVDSTTEAPTTEGRKQAATYELFGEPGSLGTTKSVIKTINKSGKSIKLIFGSVVRVANSAAQEEFGISVAWDNPTIEVDELGTTGNWTVDELFEWRTQVTATSDQFLPLGTDTGFIMRVATLQSSTPPPGLTAERQFEKTSQLADVSHYNELEKSNASAPEHEIVYVNELISNETTPEYTKLTTAGFALKASRNYNNVDQVRFWLAEGVSVQRFHPDDSEIGPSNLFCDLVYYVLTDKTAGVGGLISPELIKSEDFPATAQFLRTNKLFFDGAISDSVNVRQFIADTAPFMLCNFVISDGRFSVVPAVPTTSSGAISTSSLQIKQLFTAGNIIEDSFSLEFLSAEERKNFQAVMRYRVETKNQLPEERTVVVRYKEPGSSSYPIESFDMTQYCTTRDHAVLAAKYFLAIRRHITHTITFKTTPYGLDLAPGDYIKVATEASPYQAANNGVISSTGVITSATTLSDGTYDILLYRNGDDDVTTSTMTVAGGKAIETALWNSLFTINDTTVSTNVYMIEQLTLDGDGLVEIVGMHAPTVGLSSQVAVDLAAQGLFETEG
jgi:hypothetical protein